MKYHHIEEGTFIERPNRFIAKVLIGGREEICHVKNTGRCRELFLPGATLYLEHSDKKGRKTAWDVIGVKKGEVMVNVDSQLPNYLVAEWIRQGNLFADVELLKQEQKYGNSRFDLYLEAGGKKIFIEVKGVTLEEDGVAMFPDAPTQRGVKHIYELCECVGQGYEGYVFFVIQMKGVHTFTPHEERHKEFKDALVYAREKGVHILAYDCLVSADEVVIDQPVEVCLDLERE